MTDDLLTPEDLAEIERKVARFRAVVTQAAQRRRERECKPESAALVAKRAARRLLDQPAVQISILERLLAGERYTTLAPEYHHSAAYLASHMRSVVQFQMQAGDYSLDDTTSEWARCLFAPRAEFRQVWMPLALARLRAQQC
jgi:hypothetical protein